MGEEYTVGRLFKNVCRNFLIMYCVWSAFMLYGSWYAFQNYSEFEAVVMQYADQETIDKINAHYQQKDPDKYGKVRLTKEK